MTSAPHSPSPITRRFRRYKMQCAATAAVADALKHAPRIFSHAKHQRIRVLARRMAACAATTTIRLITPPGDATHIVYRNQRSCRTGLCMPCARVRAHEANKRLGQRLDAIVAEAPQTRFAFLTLTSRNRPIAEVAVMFADHEQALSRFWRRQDIERAIIGHITGIEIALRVAANAWQAGVHSHSLAALHPDYFDKRANLYLSQRRLVDLWRHALRTDYNPICHITAVPQGGNIHTSLRECVKYAVAPHKLFRRGKAFTVDPLVVLYLADALYKRRLIRCGGILASSKRRRKRAVAHPSTT